MKSTKLLVVFFGLALVLASCGKFEKFRKKATVQEKYKAAINYYSEGELNKASILLEEIMPLIKGDTIQENATYIQAKCDMESENWAVASEHFTSFAETFSRSPKYKEALYLSALCRYKASPEFNLDQTETKEAINQIQAYINNYPDTEFMDECNRMIKELRQKLEKKSFEKAKLYYTISPFNIANLKSAVIEINNFQKDFPDSRFSEEVAFLKVKAQYELAEVTIPSLQKERYEETKQFYLELLEKYPESEYLANTQNLYANAIEKLVEINQEEAEIKRLEEEKKDQGTKVTGSQEN